MSRSDKRGREGDREAVEGLAFPWGKVARAKPVTDETNYEKSSGKR